jgi:hypothetical protein
VSGLVEVLVKLVLELVSLYSPEWRCVWTGRGTGQTGPRTGSVLPSTTRPAGQLLMFLKPVFFSTTHRSRSPQLEQPSST